MKFQLLILAPILFVTDAFVTSSSRAVSVRQFGISHKTRPVRSQEIITRQLAEDDLDEDDDDDEEESEGPLSRGVDSVAWLPSAIGSRADGIDALTKKDSEIIPLVRKKNFSLDLCI
jgi:hypothetical protein